MNNWTVKIWHGFLDLLHGKTEDKAIAMIMAMPGDDVLAFWAWHDREAAICIAEASVDEREEMIADYRDALARDVVAEIRYRAGV